jgi:hypothetical protein
MQYNFHSSTQQYSKLVYCNKSKIVLSHFYFYLFSFKSFEHLSTDHGLKNSVTILQMLFIAKNFLLTQGNNTSRGIDT